jgi:hypothetical protein
MRQTVFVVGMILVLCQPGLARAAINEDNDPLGVDNKITWIQWWECNRDAYLGRSLLRGHPKPSAAPNVVIGKAVAALLPATHVRSRDVRAEAVLALARIGQGGPRLFEMTTDPDQRVRCRAWIALGLTGQQQLLLDQKGLPHIEMVAVETALGLLDEPKPDVLTRLRADAKSARFGEVQRTAIWALRVFHTRHPDDDKAGSDSAILLDVIQTSQNLPVVAEAVLALGPVGGSKNLAQLTEIANLGPRSMKLPVFARMYQKTGYATGPNRATNSWQLNCLRAAACLAIAETGPGPKPPRDPNDILPPPAEVTRLADETAEDVLVTNAFKLNCGLRGESTYFPGVSTLALGRFDAGSVLQTLLAVDDWPLTPQVMRDRQGKVINILNHVGTEYTRFQPQRGCAAIALGLAGSSRDVLQATADNFNETRHVRTAAVLALGLNNDKANADGLTKLADRLNPQKEPLIYGHVVLALGLLQDPRALIYADRFGLGAAKSIDVKRVLDSDFDSSIRFEPPQEGSQIETMDVMLGTRAALLGLAALGDDRARPALLANWGVDPYVSLESARAMGWCGVYDGVDPMNALIGQTKKPAAAAWAARSLGELLDPDRPSKLGRLVAGNAYFFPVQWTDKWADPVAGSERTEHEFQGLSNPLLYWQILPRPNGQMRSDLPWQF